jgi:hypothetical protein
MKIQRTPAVWLAFFLLMLLAGWHLCLHPMTAALRPAAPAAAPTEKILLVPLDSRPPCGKAVQKLGAIAGLEVVLPPAELMDYYSQPGETEAMRTWLMEAASAPGIKAVILSTDQLLYGGLLAAREREASPEARQSLLDFLRSFHAAHPNLPVYAFSILPRLSPQDTIDGYEERRALTEYSRLIGKKAAGLEVDEQKLAAARAKISDTSLETYEQHFRENEDLNEKLIDLTKDGVLTRLVLGQDDGEPYGIPNLEKEALRQRIASLSLTENEVLLTHGADEIAQSLLAGIVNQRDGLSPRVCVRYADAAEAEQVMPYMAVSTGETIREKIALIGGQETDRSEDADFLLFVSTSDREAGSLDQRQESLLFLRSALEQGRPTALVDLSKHFETGETLLPLLLRYDFPVTQLLAYAGWNTTSNACGTALAQASLAAAARSTAPDADAALASTAANERFLLDRVLEDGFYLKEDISKINHRLKKAGYKNTADLDLEHNHRWATAMLQKDMAAHAARWKNRQALRALTPVPEAGTSLGLYDLKTSAGFPWPRTFEIDLDTEPFFGITP